VKNSIFSFIIFLFRLFRRDDFRSFFDLQSSLASFFLFLFNLNKWFLYISSFFCVFFYSVVLVWRCFFFFVWVRRCSVHHLVRRCLISHFVAVFVWFLLKDHLKSITCSISDLSVNVADTKAWVLCWFRFYHIICWHFALICY